MPWTLCNHVQIHFPPLLFHALEVFKWISLPPFLSLCCLSLSGFRIKTELHSRTVLDSRDRDYPPWSFYRQEIVRCKTLPEGLATSVLTDWALACIREERETVLSFLTHHLTREREESSEPLQRMLGLPPEWSVLWKTEETGFCILPCQR